MSTEGSQLARAMMSIHEAEMEQASRYPGSDLSDRIERRTVLQQRKGGALCRLGAVLVKIGRRLQQQDMPHPVPLKKKPAQTG
jgi:hypothetical protein